MRLSLFLESKRIPIVIQLLAFTSSLVFSLVIYPQIAGQLQSSISADRYDRLALGLYHYGTLSFYPDPQASILRGPVYPAFVALIIFIRGSLASIDIQIAQAVVHSFTSLLCFGISSILWSRKRASIASIACAVHPFLLWYTPRIVTETVATFFFTAIIYTFLKFSQNPSYTRSLFLGITMGVSTLCKQTFLPLMALLPALSFFSSEQRKRFGQVLLIPLVALIIVFPWTLRNYNLTRALVPVHTLMGFNFQMGDCLTENYSAAPLSYLTILEKCESFTTAEGDTVFHLDMEKEGVLQGLKNDRLLAQQSLQRYLDNPGFFIRKVVLNAVMFWTISATVSASVVTTLLQVPVLLCFLVASVKIMRKNGAFGWMSIPIWLVLAYFLSHLPIYALARFGLPLVPTMIAYCSGLRFSRTH